MLELLSPPKNIHRARGISPWTRRISLGPVDYPSDPWNIPRTRGISLGPVKNIPRCDTPRTREEYPSDPFNIPRTRLISFGPV